MAHEITLKQSISCSQKPIHIVSISFICRNIKKHTSFSSFKYNSNCTLTKKINPDIHEHVTTGFITFCSAGIALGIVLK